MEVYSGGQGRIKPEDLNKGISISIDFFGSTTPHDGGNYD
jgi:hypothetical protein